MTRTAKDGLATLLMLLAVLTFFATHEAWNVWLVGDSHRWAAAVIGLLGIGACALGEARDNRVSRVLAGLGIVALALFVWAIWSASLTPLSLLVVAIVLLWVAATAEHMAHPSTA